MPANARWIILVLVAVTALTAYFAGRGPVGTPSHASCLTHRDCAKGESCVVVPKDDGFATMGTCGEPCQTDGTCPNGWRCTPYLESASGTLVPIGTRGASGARQLVCSPRKG